MIMKPAGLSHNVAVFIGRFRPFHTAHKAVLDVAFNKAQLVILVIGSAFAARDARNLFKEREIERMIRASLTDEQNNRFKVIYIPDYGNTTRWCADVNAKVRAAKAEFDFDDSATTALVGHKKDGSSFYLSLFQHWDSIDVASPHPMNATDIRYLLIGGIMSGRLSEALVAIADMVPEGTMEEIVEIMKDPDFQRVKGEIEFMDNYLKQFDCEGNRKYKLKPKFYTADNVVIQGGHILLVQRGDYPCKGAWALPGGHVEDDETAERASVRELAEETKIDVPKRTISKSLIASRTFDNPYRSTRGRTITNAFIYHLQPTITGTDPARIKKDLALPKVRATKESKKAKWFPIDVVLGEMRETLMEDHAQIIEWAVSELEKK